jgi:ACT domain-containing protein
MATNTVINVSYQTEHTGPWTPVQIVIDLQKFVDAKSPDKYVKELVELGNMGSPVISISYNYSKEVAQKMLDIK